MSKTEPIKDSTPEIIPSFSNDFIHFFREYESPTSFWRWASYAIIAATLRDRVYFQHGAGKIYPNIYVVLLADSAEYRKGAPLAAVREILTLLKVTKLFSGTASIQGILDELSQDVADRSTGQPIKGGSSLIIADELAAFFVEDRRLIPLLTDLWEFREDYDYKLRGGSIKIKNVCCNLLAASNETFLREVYDSRAVYGGLLGRTYLIKPDETRTPESLMYMDLEKYNKKPLMDSLFKIKQLSGSVKRTDDGAKFYHEWYNDLYSKYKKHPDKTGVIQRMHTNVLKLAIILAASRYTLEITKEIFEEAIFQVTSLKQNYELYVMSAGKSDMAEVGSKFLAALWDAPDHKIKRREFLMKNWAEVSAEDFDKLLETLRQANAIEIVVAGTEVGYMLTPAMIERIQKKEEKK